LWIAGVIELNCAYHKRFWYSGLEQLTNRLPIERLVEAQGGMWAKSVPRARERQSARNDPVVENPQGTMRIDRQDEDVRLHEPLRSLE